MKMWAVLCIIWLFLSSSLVLIEIGLLFAVGGLLATLVYGGPPHDLMQQIIVAFPKTIRYALLLIRVWTPLPLFILTIANQAIHRNQFKGQTLIIVLSGLVCLIDLILYLGDQDNLSNQGIFFGTQSADLLGYALPIIVANSMLVYVSNRSRL